MVNQNPLKGWVCEGNLGFPALGFPALHGSKEFPV